MSAPVINLDTLSPQEITEIHRTMVLEIEAVTENQKALRMAYSKYQQSHKAVESLQKSSQKSVESLIPLTSSMYMTGEIKEVKKVMVDIGTQFYVEKSLDEALTFFKSKLDLVQDNLDKLEAILASKRNDLAKVRASMQLRLNKMQQQQQQQQQTAK